MPEGKLIQIRTEKKYGCVKNASVVVDTASRRPFMQLGGALHPLSEKFGAVIRGSRLEQDIGAIVQAV